MGSGSKASGLGSVQQQPTASYKCQAAGVSCVVQDLRGICVCMSVACGCASAKQWLSRSAAWMFRSTKLY